MKQKKCTFNVLLSVLTRCSLLLTVWFLQRFIKEVRNSLFVDGLRSPIGERLASFRWMYSLSISSELFSPAPRKVCTSSALVSNGFNWFTGRFAGMNGASKCKWRADQQQSEVKMCWRILSTKLNWLKKSKHNFTFFFFLTIWNNCVCLVLLLCDRAFLAGIRFQRPLPRWTFQNLGHIRSVCLLFRLMRVYLSWAHHGDRFPDWRRCLRDQVHPGLPVLSKRGGRALWCHCADRGGRRTVCSTGDCGRVRGRKGTLEDNAVRF